MKKTNSVTDTEKEAVSDEIIVNDSSGRRHFIRSGAAFLLAGAIIAKAETGAKAGTGSVAGEKKLAQEPTDILVADCDSTGYVGEKDGEVAGNDSDAGAEADRPGCGRKKTPLTEYKKQPGNKKVRVAKVNV